MTRLVLRRPTPLMAVFSPNSVSDIDGGLLSTTTSGDSCKRGNGDGSIS